ncbi:hypothetical protein GCM10023214_15340 [Amycolatopsis dongchuanensis]|uniref:Uncharacterized protein n=1 Tax=Amycolatopsis dongchuanensis TaxID=1070866 RepID=A0ABP9Q5K8_9PSEU
MRLEDLHSVAEYLQADSDNLGNASVTYTDSIPCRSAAMLGPRSTAAVTQLPSTNCCWKKVRGIPADI